MEEENQEKQQEHQHLSKHERRELKRLKREEERNKIEENKKKKKSTKNIITYSIIAVVVIGFVYLVYFLISRAPSTNNDSVYDLSGIPSGIQHFHADIDVFICGEDQDLPDGLVGGHLGGALSHTHDVTTNKNSMPSSDGDGVMHLEGNVKANPSESTFVKYMKNIGINFNENQIMDKKNGDLCGDKNGTVNVYVNDKKYDKDINYYIPRDNDFVEIRFE